MSTQIETVRALTDNYCYLVRGTNRALVIDPSEAAPIRAALRAKGWTLGAILNTHHHHDHVGGNAELAKEFACDVYCATSDLARVPGATKGVRDGEHFEVEGLLFQALAIPGHTRGQLAYWLNDAQAVFVGDTMFSMGCGRLFEGTPAEMLASLDRLAKLPPETRLYFGHEYTEKNAGFALNVEPDNPAIETRLRETRAAIARQSFAEAPTIASELKVNPFLREASPSIREHLGLNQASRVEVFAELRERRNRF